jgi:hypothetical protein
VINCQNSFGGANPFETRQFTQKDMIVLLGEGMKNNDRDVYI